MSKISYFLPFLERKHIINHEGHDTCCEEQLAGSLSYLARAERGDLKLPLRPAQIGNIRGGDQILRTKGAAEAGRTKRRAGGRGGFLWEARKESRHEGVRGTPGQQKLSLPTAVPNSPLDVMLSVIDPQENVVDYTVLLVK